MPVHALSRCSNNENWTDSPVNFSRLEDTATKNVDEETLARESWNRKSKRQRNNNFYQILT